mgnify:CR=1 FL=1
MIFTLLHNRNCSKSRACIEILNQNNVTFKVREYMKKPLSLSEIKDLISHLDGNKFDLLRSGSEKANNQNFEEFLFKNQKNLQRPIFFDGSKYVICRPPNKILDLIENY